MIGMRKAAPPSSQPKSGGRIALGLFALLLATLASAAPRGDGGPTWTRLTNNRPAVRCYTAMATDTHRNRVVLFGGWNGTALNDTWEWDGSVWRKITPSGGNLPQPRRLHAMAFDEERLRVVMCGGLNAHDDILRDTWEWDGSRWRRVDNAGPPVYGHAMAYDAARHNTVVFGGVADHDHGQEISNATYTWDGTTWAHATDNGPLARYLHAMAYDQHRERIVMFGGRSSQFGASEQYGDVWEWNGQSWTFRMLAGLVPREQHAMTWDPQRQHVVMFGGISGSTILRQTHEWTGDGWDHIAQGGPPPRYGHAMAFDPVAGRAMLFGGQSHRFWKDTWVFGP